MEAALGKMLLPPDVFWNMSFPEFYAAVQGFSEFNSSGKPPPLRKTELEEMMEMYPD